MRGEWQTFMNEKIIFLVLAHTFYYSHLYILINILRKKLNWSLAAATSYFFFIKIVVISPEEFA